MGWLAQFVDGIALGCTYALVALGYTLVFGVLNVLNMAHGDLFMVGSYCGFICGLFITQNPVVAILFGFLGAGIIGLIMERLAIRPVFKEHLTPLLTTVGVSVILQNSVQKIFGPNQQNFPFEFKSVTLWGYLRLPSIAIVNLGVSVLIMVFLFLFIEKTKYGWAIKSVAEKPETAGMLGVNVKKIMSLTVGFASALGGVAGVLLGMTLGSISPFMGTNFGIKGLTVLIVAGTGHIVGAMLFGLILGLIEVYSVSILSSAYRDLISVIILILIFLVRPQGLFGKASRA